MEGSFRLRTTPWLFPPAFDAPEAAAAAMDGG
jgi:hypothetical protein